MPWESSWPGIARRKTRVNALVSIDAFLAAPQQAVDACDERGHDAVDSFRSLT
jgi:hypothetical protein